MSELNKLLVRVWCICLEKHSFNFCENSTLAGLTFPLRAGVIWGHHSELWVRRLQLSDLVFRSPQIYLWGTFKFFLSFCLLFLSPLSLTWLGPPHFHMDFHFQNLPSWPLTSCCFLPPSLPPSLHELCCPTRILEPWLRHAAPRTRMPGSENFWIETAGLSDSGFRDLGLWFRVRVSTQGGDWDLQKPSS